MLVSLEWLKDYVDIKLSPKDLAAELTVRAIEVDSISKQGRFLDNVVVGEVLEIKEHPKADRLNVAKVKIGQQVKEIVCGGTNLKVGQKVPVALVGARVNMGSEECEIKSTEIRGIKSNGMICSNEELGLPQEKNDSSEPKIMVLPKDAKVGTSLKKYFGFNDTVIGLDVLANRPDLMGHEGVAREIAAVTGAKFKLKEDELPIVQTKNFPLTITLPSAKLVPRYSALVISGLKNIASPKWLADRLQTVGVRSINYIVDVTNYIMLDVGLPLHAFDYNKISGKNMAVREAKAGEKVETLDGVKRKLEAGMLVIADKKELIDLAGIMGGKASEVDDKTNTIVLQAAVFNPILVRRTASFLNHRTDAVGRYEKGVDATATIKVLAKAFKLLKQEQPDIKLEYVFDQGTKEQSLRTISFDPSLVVRLGGVDVEVNKCKEILSSLGMKIATKGKNLDVTVPSFRSDVNLPEDLVEEVMRIYGYDKIPEKLLPLEDVAKFLDKKLKVRQKTKTTLSNLGFFETINYSFLGKEETSALGLDYKKHIQITNPLDERQSVMRTELLSGILRNVRDNLRFNDRFCLYELGNVFLPGIKKQVKEVEMLAGICVNTHEYDNEHEVFYHTKGAVETVLKSLNINNVRFAEKRFSQTEKTSSFIYHPGRTAEVWLGSTFVGLVSEVHTLAAKAFGIKERVGVFELEMERIIALALAVKRFKPISKYPPVTLDLAFLAPEKVLISDVISAMLHHGRPLLTNVELFDEYRGKKLPEGKKSLAFHVTYQSPDKTLSDAEVRSVQEKIITHLNRTLGVTLRDV